MAPLRQVRVAVSAADPTQSPEKDGYVTAHTSSEPHCTSHCRRLLYLYILSSCAPHLYPSIHPLITPPLCSLHSDSSPLPPSSSSCSLYLSPPFSLHSFAVKGTDRPRRQVNSTVLLLCMHCFFHILSNCSDLDLACCQENG